MKRSIMFAFLLVPNLVYGMDKQDDMVLGKLKMILTAGTRYVYSEHMSIHSDAKRRASAMCSLWAAGKDKAIGVEMKKYALFVDRVIKVYIKCAPHPDPVHLADLENTRETALKWTSFPEDFRTVLSIRFQFDLQRQVLKSTDLYIKARDARDAFQVKDGDTSCVLPLHQAVTAWCLNLPEPYVKVASSDSSLN